MAFEHTYPGQPLRIKSQDWNGAMDAARALASGELGLRANVANGGGEWLVKNESGLDLPQFSVLGVTGIRFAPSDNLATFKAGPMLLGDIPVLADHAGKFVVITEALGEGKIGPCVTMGVVQVLVDEAAGDFAEVADGSTTHLARGDTGSRILWVDGEEHDTDRFWALVLIGSGGSGGCQCQEVHEIRIDGTATAGTISVAYTIGTSGSASINWNSTAASAKTALIAGHSFFTTSNIDVYDGPFPNAGFYVVFGDDLPNGWRRRKGVSRLLG
jgi:hypothetical protein